MDQKLKLQIVTALDAAGIKATKQQIDSLEKSIGNVGKTGATGLEQFEAVLVRIPGKAGKALQALGGPLAKIGGAVFAIYKAWEWGWEIGTKIEKQLEKWGITVEDVEAKIKKANKELDITHEKHVKDYEYVSQKMNEQFKISDQRAKDELENLKQQRDEYNALRKAKSELYNIGQDAELQQLERERFEDVTSLEQAGMYDEAKQANALYDVYRKQLEQKIALRKEDEKTNEIIEQRRQKYQDEITRLNEIVRKTKDKRAEDNYTVGYWNRNAISQDEWNKRAGKADTRLKSGLYEERISKANARIRRLTDEMNGVGLTDAEYRNYMYRSALIRDKYNLGEMQSLYNFDKLVQEKGNLLGLNPEDEFWKSRNEEFVKSAEDVKTIANTVGEILTSIQWGEK